MSDQQDDEPARSGAADQQGAEVLPDLIHEGRNSLQEILAGLRLLRVMLDDHDETREILDDLAKSGRRLERLFADLNDYGAPLRVEVGPCDAAEAWRTACVRLGGQGREREVEPCPVIADAVLLEEAFCRIAECLVGRPPDPASIDLQCVDVEVRGKPMAHITLRDSRSSAERSSGRGRAALSFAIAVRLVEAQGGQLRMVAASGAAGEVSLLLQKDRSGVGDAVE